MSVDYTRPPYSMWSKCPHSCEHHSMFRPRVNNATLTYKVDDETIGVGTILVFHRHSRILRLHATNGDKHPDCTPACPGYRWLDSNTASPTDLRTSLTAEDWRRWGLGIALMSATSVIASDVPAEYIHQISTEFPAEYKALTIPPKRRNSKVKPKPLKTHRKSAPHGVNEGGAPTSSAHKDHPVEPSSTSLQNTPLLSFSSQPAADPSQIRTDLLPIPLVSHLHTAPPKPSPDDDPTPTTPSYKMDIVDTNCSTPQAPTSHLLASNSLREKSTSPTQTPESTRRQSRNILPLEPLAYTLSIPSSEFDPAFLLPPSEFSEQAPLYRVSVSLNIHPIQPPCYTTHVCSGGAESGDTIAQFKMSLDHRWGTLTMDDETTEISNVLSTVDSNPRHFKWSFHNIIIGWDCDATREDGSLIWICYTVDDLMTPIASYVPPSDIWKPVPAVLTVSPDGHRGDLLDHILVSALIVNRKLS